MGLIVVVTLQAMFAAHAIQRDHGWHWVFLILFCPILGLMLYAYYVAIPELQYSQDADQAEPDAQPFCDAQSEIAYYQHKLDLAKRNEVFIESTADLLLRKAQTLHKLDIA